VDQAEIEPLLCPLCEYDLRGSVEPRCSECGYAFTWEEIRDPARRLHPYAFEHHPERNVWSFRRTLLAGLRPGRFWRTLFPTPAVAAEAAGGVLADRSAHHDLAVGRAVHTAGDLLPIRGQQMARANVEYDDGAAR
jgi:hypothetical protein